MSGLLLRRAELDGDLVDIRIDGGRIAEIGSLIVHPQETVLDAAGGAALPGLHDHHLHLLSMAAAATSVQCGPPQVTSRAGLARALSSAPPGWVRGVGYHESVAGMLGRDDLDALAAGRPVRVQHRGGALWSLNSQALAELGLRDTIGDEPGIEPDDEPGVERDADGRLTGRLWRADALLRDRLDRHGGRPASDTPDLAAVGRRLAAFGITGVTDATPNLGTDAVRLLADAVGSGQLPQRVRLLGAPLRTKLPHTELPPGLECGPWKILPPDHEPPDWQNLRAEVVAAREAGRAVAIHAVTRESLVVSLAVLAEVGTIAGDRIEHAALVDDDVLPMFEGQAVVTQPAFIVERGDEYLRDVPPAEHDVLYRYAGLLAADVRVAPSSDAPFATPDPWQTIAAAVNRETRGGAALGRAERVPAARVLAGYLSPPDDPGGPPRRLIRGAPADLCVLRVPLAEALRTPDADAVLATVQAGEVVYQRS